MLQVGEVGYNWIDIAFPRTNAYRNMCADGDTVNEHFTPKYQSHSIHYFPWQDYGIGACIDAGIFIELGYFADKSFKIILAEGAGALKSDFLEPLKPKIRELREKEFVELEGIRLLKPESNYLIAPIKKPPEYRPGPLDLLYRFAEQRSHIFSKSINYLITEKEMDKLDALEMVQTAASFPRQIGITLYEKHLDISKKPLEECISCDSIENGIESLMKAYEFDTKTFDDIMGLTRYIEVLQGTIDGPSIDGCS